MKILTDPAFVGPLLRASNGNLCLSETERRLRGREWSRKHREKRLHEVRRANRLLMEKKLSTVEGRMNHLLTQARRRARTSGIEFNISLGDLKPFPIVCPALGISLNYQGHAKITSGIHKRGFQSTSASIDRIDSSKGYIAGNVQVISWRANRIKADATPDELRRLLTYMERAQCT